MTHTRYAFIKASWHANIVNNALSGFLEHIPKDQVDSVTVHGAMEIPLMAKRLALSGQYQAIIGCAFIVDGGIYRHEFVAQSVVSGIMQVGLETDVPILSVVLTRQCYQETPHHDQIFETHFVHKGREAAQAALALTKISQIDAA